MIAEPDVHRIRLRLTSHRLKMAFNDLRGALGRFNARADKLALAPDGDGLNVAVADANRALARAEVLMHEQELLCRQGCCLRCQGEGRITERGVLLRRVRCSDCAGTGVVTAPHPTAPHPAAARGRWQRLILTALLTLGGASWPVPLARLWGTQTPSPADRAALSRALATLERGGLLDRSYRRGRSRHLSLTPVPRASRAQLTVRGAELAETLTNAAPR